MKNITIEKCPTLAEVEISYKSKVKASERRKITNSKDTAAILRECFDPAKIEYREEFIILMLNRSMQVLGWVKISTGGIVGTMVDSRLIFQAALNANATGIILAHNHPSGNLRPSPPDIAITKKLVEAGKILEIDVLDHIILTEETHYSFADEGQI